MKDIFLMKFNIEAWKSLTQTEKDKHTLSCCKACQEEFPELENTFPRSAKCGKNKAVQPHKCSTISLSTQDLSSSAALGGRILKELTSISQQVFNKTGQEVLTETPRSNLIKRPSVKESRKQNKQIEREIKNAIAIHKGEVACSMVLQNRVSWKTYDRIRKSDGMTTPTRPPVTRKRKYHHLSETREINKEKLLQEAEAWPADKCVNWSQLARDYGLNTPNGGQIIKELLAEHNIHAALRNQRPSRAKRRCLRKIGSEVPMFPPGKHERQKLSERIETKEIDIGDEVVPSSKLHSKFSQSASAGEHRTLQCTESIPDLYQKEAA